MAKDIAPDPWERQPKESAKAYAAFCIYRDMGVQRALRKVTQALNKNLTTIAEWSSKYDWVNRCAAWDAEVDRVARQKQLKDIATMREKQRKNAQTMQEKGMAFLESLAAEEALPALKDIVQLLKLGMEQERICAGDVGEVIEERNGGEAIPSVQIYIPSNSREKENTNFDDLEV